MGLIDLPVELLEMVIEDIILDEWNHSNRGCEALNMRIICSKLAILALYYLCVLGRANGVSREV
jgi:hypothetical protein